GGEVRPGLPRDRAAAHRRPADAGARRGAAPLIASRFVRAARAAVFAALLLAAIAPSAGAAPSADARFTKLGDEFLAHWLALRPWTASRLGLHGSDELLAPVTQTTLASEREWLRDFRARLDRVPRASLSFERALERDVLSARV